MKAVMYHYVRRHDPELPYFTYLDFDSFRRQLDWFESVGRLASREEFEEALERGQPLPDVFVPTFDDGLVEHAQLVAHELERRGTFGVFFVPTAPLETGCILDVHRIHLLLGRHGGGAMLDALDGLLGDRRLPGEGDARRAADTYRHQPEGPAARFKRILNYQASGTERQALLDALCASHLSGTAWASRLYMTESDVRALERMGMIVGGHSRTHELLSRLSPLEQEAEITGSLQALSGVIGRCVEWFAYPYGGWHSFGPLTETILARHGVRFAFNVEDRDIAPWDLRRRPLALPRYDCNLFPHGRAVDGDALSVARSI